MEDQRGVFVPRACDEQAIDLGEVRIDHVVAGPLEKPALPTAAGQPFEPVQAPDAAHGMHAADPERFAGILSSSAAGLRAGAH